MVPIQVVIAQFFETEVPAPPMLQGHGGVRSLQRWLAASLLVLSVTVKAGFPGISSFSPSAGAQGQVVTISGTGFSSATKVTFGASGAEAVFQKVSDSTITATVPTNGLTGQLSVTASGFTVTSSGYFYVAPRVSGFLPAKAAVGAQIRIDGENFSGPGLSSGNVGVLFSGNVAGYGLSVVSSQQLYVNVPTGASNGPVIIGVGLGFTNLYGSGNTNFIVTGAGPVITGFTPSSALPGAQILIEGGDFTGATSVTFNGTNAPNYRVTASTQIYVNVPADATSGPISVTTALGTAVSDTDFIVSGAPVVTSFTPGGGPVGSLVLLSGSRFIGATNVLFNGVAASFHVTADNQIDAAVPATALTGPISVQNAFGTGSSSANYIVGSAPTITNFAPVGGPAGTPVTVRGLFFDNVTAVRFNGSNAAFHVTAQSSELVANVPVDAGTGPITVETLTGTNTTTSNFLFGAAPVISGFTPYAGQTNTVVTISGNNFFAGRSVVKFNGLISSNASVTAQSQISAPVPFGAITGPITIETPLGTNTSTTNFFVTPYISGFSPGNGGAGQDVLITGLNFIGAQAVRFNGADASFQVSSNSGIIAQVPTNTTTGPVSVLTPAGIVTTTTNFAIAPKLYGFTPAAAPVGSTITITGAALSTPITVQFNGLAATAVVLDSVTQVRAAVPVGASSGAIRVTTPDGVALSPTSFFVQPAITSFTPTNGGFGTVVTINGTTLGAATAVKIGGASVSSFQIVSSTQLKATVPAGANTGAIEVFTADASGSSSQLFYVSPVVIGFSPVTGVAGDTVRIDGLGLDTVTSVAFNGASTTAFTVTEDNRLDVVVPIGATTGPITVVSPSNSSQTSSNFTVLPKVTSFSPASGGFVEEVILSGGGFSGVTNVQFNGTAAVFDVLSSTSIRAYVPASATSGPLRVNTAAGTAQSANNFIVVPPTIVGFSPATAKVGDTVVISGFSLGGPTNVTFNGITASFVTNSFTQITATVPATASYGPLRIATPAGVAVSGDSFGVTPVITAISPTSGAVGTFVTITGNGFLGALSVKFNGLSAASFTVNSSTQITAQVPATVSKGSIRVKSPGGFSDSATEFQPLLPGIAGFAPVQGGAGTVVTISGANLGGTTSVEFNGAAVTPDTITDAEIKVVVPLAATTGPLRVLGTGTDYQTSSNFTVLPVITGFSPREGNAGDTVIIDGTLFSSATEVRFGNGKTTQFTINSATRITVNVPDAATSGAIQIVTTAGTATSTNSFTVFPALVSFMPDHGPVGAVVDLYGVNLAGNTSLTLGGLPLAFTNLSATHVTGVIADGSLSGTFRMVTPQGSVDSATVFRVTPRIDAFSPKGGLPGDKVLLMGSAFTGATNVIFSTGQSASFVVGNYNQISVTVPDGATNGPVTVQTPSGDGTSSIDFPVGAVLFTGPSAGSQLMISWSTNATNYTLEFTTDLSAPIIWQPLNATPAMQGGSNTVVISNSDPPRYFRLKK